MDYTSAPSTPAQMINRHATPKVQPREHASRPTTGCKTDAVATRHALRRAPPAIEYSDAPLSTIDVASLPASRYIDAGTCLLPFRDELGRVSLPLIEWSLSSLADAAARLPEADASPHLATLSAWRRHAARAIARRPADELQTLDDMLVAEAHPPNRCRLFRGEAEEPPSPREAAASDEASEASEHSDSGGAAKSADGSNDDAESDEPVSPRTPRAARSAARSADPSLPIQCVYIASAIRSSSDSDERASPTSPAARRGKARRGLSRAVAPSSASDDEVDRGEDVFEVEAVLDEDSQVHRPTPPQHTHPIPTPSPTFAPPSTPTPTPSGHPLTLPLARSSQHRFLIRWTGYGAEHDSWEPEENVAPNLVSDFRHGRLKALGHAGADYSTGRTRWLWCASCAEHRSVDSFSAAAKRTPPASRACLIHHYRLTPATAAVSSTTTAAAAAAPTLGLAKTPARAGAAASLTSSPSSASKKRRRVGEAEDEPRAPPPTPSSSRLARPIARSLTERQASQRVARSRNLGLSYPW